MSAQQNVDQKQQGQHTNRMLQSQVLSTRVSFCCNHWRISFWSPELDNFCGFCGPSECHPGFLQPIEYNVAAATVLHWYKLCNLSLCHIISCVAILPVSHVVICCHLYGCCPLLWVIYGISSSTSWIIVVVLVKRPLVVRWDHCEKPHDLRRPSSPCTFTAVVSQHLNHWLVWPTCC